MASRPDDWSRLKDIFAHARAMPANARAAYMLEACSGDDLLRHEVESLLAADKRAERFLESRPRLLDSERTESLEGRCIGAYQIGSRIGAGGMGEVYEGRDTILNRQVAIKVLLPIVAQDSERVTRFRREAQLLASLNHPHIAQIHGFEHAEDVWALVMELVPGPTLAQRIAGRASVDPIAATDGASKGAPLPVAEALRRCRANRRRPGSRTRAGNHPPRLEALQRQGSRGRHGEGPRFRSGHGTRLADAPRRGRESLLPRQR